jgi:hypothetical protein
VLSNGCIVMHIVPDIAVPLAGHGSAQDRWLAAQQQVQAERLAAGGDESDAGSSSDAQHDNSTSEAESVDARREDVPAAATAEPLATQPSHSTVNMDLQTGQQAGTRMDAAAADDRLQTIEPQQRELGPLEQAAPSSSEPLSEEEQQQHLANADALNKAASMEAIRKAISVSVATASKGFSKRELPAGSVDCAKVYACVTRPARPASDGLAVKKSLGVSQIKRSFLIKQQVSHTCPRGVNGVAARLDELQAWIAVTALRLLGQSPMGLTHQLIGGHRPACMGRRQAAGASFPLAGGSGPCMMTPASSPTCWRCTCRCHLSAPLRHRRTSP